MELLYSMRRKPLKCEPPHFENPSDTEVVRPICTISVCNIIAFSSPTEITDADGDTWAGHVYVCDLDAPWDSHRVTATSHPVSALEWDNEGKQLLVATTVGDVSVFVLKEYLLNEWTCLYTASFPGEHIKAACFFHNGRRVVAVEKKPDAPIAEKFQLTRYAPTLKGFGGVGSEGACIVTGTGLAGAVTAGDCGRATVVTESLRATRDCITAASIAHKNGSLLIATLCRVSGARHCVRVYLVAVTAAPRPAPRAPAALQPQPLPALHLPLDCGPVSITWCLREEPDSLLIAGSTLSLWKLTERAHPVHKLFSKGSLQGSTTPGGGQKPGTDCFNTVVWQQVAVWPIEGGESAVHIASNRLALSPPHALLATPSAIHLLGRDKHHYVCSRPVVTHGGGADAPAGGATPPKKTKYGSGSLPAGASCAIVSHAALSPLLGVAVCIDTHAQLHVYTLPQSPDIPAPLAVQHACSLLEYAMVTGCDALDLLMSLKPGIVQPLLERFTETFQRQPQPFQQYYYHSWLKLRIALCRLVPSLAPSVSWLSSVQMLHAHWAACAGALRPDDKPESATLKLLLDDQPGLDQEKALLALEAKPESCGDVSALQALRRPLQRALDVARAVLLTLPTNQHQHHLMQSSGYEIWSDPQAVGVLRRLVVAARAAGLGGESLSRPLARLHAQGPKPELLEECASLTTQLSSPRVWEALPRCSVAAPHGRPAPLYFEYGVEPEALRYAPEPPTYSQCDTAPPQAMDSIRYMYLGGGRVPPRRRQCARCGARALPAAQPAKHPIQRAHDARFLLACRCGGKWTLFSNV